MTPTDRPVPTHSGRSRGARRLTIRWLAAVVAALAVGPAPLAYAQAPDQATPEQPSPQSSNSANGTAKPAKPWYQGVSAADRRRAGTLFAQGASFHRQKQYADAVSKYREALTHWDNPDIHFNLVQAYIALEQPVDAYASLEQATRYGLDWMTAKDRVRARDYKRLLEDHLVPLTIRCEQPGVEVTLDGKLIVTGPGADTRWVLPDSHRVRATHSDYLDYDENLTLPSGQSKELTIELTPRSSLALVAISCVEPEAEVTLDEQPLISCPGRIEKELLSGRSYDIAISRPGNIGEQKTIAPKRGERIDVALRTTTIELRPTLRWSRALPLSVVTVGLAVGIVGGVMQNQAVDDMASYDSEIDARCGPPIHGCDPEIVPPDVADLKSSAEAQNRLGVGMMLAGSAIIAAGLTLIVLNKPRAKRVEKPSEPAHTVIPTISRQGVGIATRIHF